MPWQKITVEEQRLAFAQEALRSKRPLAALCRAYGISRKTAYKWPQRFGRGLAGHLWLEPSVKPRQTAYQSLSGG